MEIKIRRGALLSRLLHGSIEFERWLLLSTVFFFVFYSPGHQKFLWVGTLESTFSSILGFFLSEMLAHISRQNIPFLIWTTSSLWPPLRLEDADWGGTGFCDSLCPWLDTNLEEPKPVPQTPGNLTDRCSPHLNSAERFTTTSLFPLGAPAGIIIPFISSVTICILHLDNNISTLKEMYWWRLNKAEMSTSLSHYIVLREIIFNQSKGVKCTNFFSLVFRIKYQMNFETNNKGVPWITTVLSASDSSVLSGHTSGFSQFSCLNRRFKKLLLWRALCFLWHEGS